MNDEKETKDKVVWIDVIPKGFYLSLKDLFINPEIEIYHVEDNGKTTIILPSLKEENGKIDLTSFFLTFLHHMQENPNTKVKAYLTDFGKKSWLEECGILMTEEK